MKNIFEFFSCLTPVEKKKLNLYFRNLHKDNKKKKLFEILQNGKAGNDKTASEFLYKSTQGKAYSRIKNKLFDDFINILFTVDEDKLVSYSLLDKNFRCSKLITVAKLLIGRSNLNNAFSILQKALKIAEKYELVNEKLSCKNILASIEGHYKGLEAFLSYHDAMEKDLLLLKEIQLTNKHYNYIILCNVHSQNKEFATLPYIKKAIKEIEGFKNFNSSPNIRFLYLNIKIHLYQLELNISKALECSRLLLDLVKQEAALKCKKNMASVYLQKSSLSIQSGNYREADNYAKQCLLNVNPKGINSIKALRLSYQALVQLKDFTSLNVLFDTIYKHPVLLKIPANLEIWNLYHAYYLYLSGDFSTSMKLLNKPLKILKDSTGWLIGYKLLEIYNLIALKDESTIEYKINNYENHVNKYAVNFHSERPLVIAKVLQVLNSNNYNFKKTAKSCKKLIAELTVPSRNKSNTHIALSSEVIPFNEWFHDRC